MACFLLFVFFFLSLRSLKGSVPTTNVLPAAQLRLLQHVLKEEKIHRNFTPPKKTFKLMELKAEIHNNGLTKFGKVHVVSNFLPQPFLNCNAFIPQ